MAFICLTLISCQKELAFTNDDQFTNEFAGMDSGTAKFTMMGVPNVCATYLVGGTYFSGTPMTGTNLVAVDVNVTETGSFFISTATINGISFSANGIFDSTGVNTILLKATGTPIAPGNFNYKVAANSCSFPVTVRPNQAGTAAIGDLDCNHASSGGIYQHGVSLDSSTLSIHINVTTPGYYYVNSAPLNGITLSGEGYLSAGLQSIDLKGHGTPVKAGAFPLAVGYGSAECSIYLTFQ